MRWPNRELRRLLLLALLANLASAVFTSLAKDFGWIRVGRGEAAVRATTFRSASSDRVAWRNNRQMRGESGPAELKSAAHRKEKLTETNSGRSRNASAPLQLNVKTAEDAERSFRLLTDNIRYAVTSLSSITEESLLCCVYIRDDGKLKPCRVLRHGSERW